MDYTSMARKLVQQDTIKEYLVRHNYKTREGIQCQIDLSGADNEGIVKVLSKYFAGKSINILEMQTHISNAPVTGTPLFNLKAITTIPKSLNLTDIQSEITQIAQKLGVEITVNQSESIAETV